MPLDPVAERYAHALYVDKLEELTRKHAARTAELRAGLAQRGMFPHTAGHYHSEMTRIGVEHIGEIANARVDSLLAAYARAKLPIDDQAVVDIVREATQFCEAQAKHLIANTQEQVGRAGMPPGVGHQLAEIIAQQISAIQARIRRKLSAKRDEEIMAARAVPQEVPPPMDKLTSGLKEKPIDRWLGLGAVVIGVVLFLVPKTPTVVVVLLVLILLLLLHPVWNFWWIEKSLSRRIVAFLIVCLLLLYVGKIAWPQAELPQSISLFAQCQASFLPSTMPADGRIYELQLNPIPAQNGGGGLAEIILHSPITATTWPKGWASTYRCDVVNYGTKTLVSIDLVLHLVFREVVPAAQGNTHSGRVTIDRDWPIEIGKVDPGKDNAFSFYINNYRGDQFVEAQLKDSVIASTVDDRTRYKSRLTRPRSEGMETMHFSPYVEPPTAKTDRQHSH